MGDEGVRRLEGDCIRLSEEMYEARAANAELAKDARDGAHWEAVADRMREEIARLNELLRYEHNRANSAIDREETAEKAAEESQQEAERLASLVGYCEHRAEESAAEVERLTRDLRISEAKVGGAALHVDRVNARVNMLENVVSAYDGIHGERDRYRLAWLSARRRAADEANFGMEALALRDDEIRRLKAELEASRQTTDAPRLEYAGEDEDGEVWRLAGS